MWKITLTGLLARKLRLALTALAIVLGVTFVTGTLVLTDTLNRTFDTLVSTAYQHINFQIRGKAAFNNDTAAAANGTVRKPIPESIAAAVRRLPGVAYVDPQVEGYAQFVSGGNAIGGAGSALGFSFDPNRQLSAVRLVDGRAPTTADDVVMDRGTATKYHFKVGDRVQVLSGRAPQMFTISGIVTFGTADNLAGTTLAGFSLPVAQVLFNTRGYYDTIDVLAKPGADDVALARAIAKVLPPGVEVVSGQTVANELSSAVSDALSPLSTALLVFALISLFVGAFTIFNTFSITVGQRTRELALLRVVGASRRQLFRSVLGEAALVGLAASVIGLGIGVLAAVGLRGAAEGVRHLAALSAARVRRPHSSRRDHGRCRSDRRIGDRPRAARGPDRTGRGAGGQPGGAGGVAQATDDRRRRRRDRRHRLAAGGIDRTGDPAGRARRNGRVRRCRHAGSDRRAADRGHPRAPTGSRARHPGEVGT